MDMKTGSSSLHLPSAKSLIVPIRDWMDSLSFRFSRDNNDYFVPEISLTTAQGEEACGPMIRQGEGRKELLAWKTKAKALQAARELVAANGGTFVIRTLKRKEIVAQCRTFTSWGSRVVAVIFE